jgi:hypothetical protein
VGDVASIRVGDVASVRVGGHGERPRRGGRGNVRDLGDMRDVGNVTTGRRARRG